MRTSPTSRPPLRPRRLRRSWTLRLGSPVVYWILVAALTLAVVVSIGAARADLDRRARRAGPTVRVAVAVGDHRAGERLGPGDVAVVEVPRSVVAADALRHAPVGRRITTDVGDREVLVRRRLVGGNGSSLAAAVPAGGRAVAVPLPPGGLAVRPADRVDLLAPGADGRAERLAEDATVLDAGESSVTVAVAAGEAGPVVDATLAGTIAVVLRGAQ